jgi:hypothetical protein
MSDIWSKALRAGPSGATPRSKSYSNNRYGGQGRGGADDEVDSADSCASKRAPARQPGVHDRPWKDMVCAALGASAAPAHLNQYLP